MFETVTIVGVGLIGGSFGLALRRAGFSGRILGVSSPEAIKIAIERGAIDEGLPLEEALPQSDLVYLSQQVQRILKTLDQIDELLKPGALVTDAGSTKQAIVARAEQTIKRGTFLGGRPMAGKEQPGVEHASADLFEERLYVITPSSSAPLTSPPVQEFCQLVEQIGARLLVLEPAEHDFLVALTSHLPQLASTALATTVRKMLPENTKQWPVGPGLLDMTRLALSPFSVWQDILETNSERIEQALQAYIQQLEEILGRLRTDPTLLASVFSEANIASRRLRQHPTSTED